MTGGRPNWTLVDKTANVHYECGCWWFLMPQPHVRDQVICRRHGITSITFVVPPYKTRRQPC